MSGSPASIRRTASPIMGWSSISKTVTLCWVKTGSLLMLKAPSTLLDKACDPWCDPVKVQDLLGGAELDGGPGHAPDDAGGLVLGDGPPAAAAECQQSLGTVVEHAGQQRRDAGPGPVLGDAGEEHVDRGPVAGRPGLRGVMEAAVLAQDQMVIGDGEQDLAGNGPVPFSDQSDRPMRLLGEPLTQPPGQMPQPGAER